MLEKTSGHSDDTELIKDIQRRALLSLASVVRFLSVAHTGAVLAESTGHLVALRSLLLVLAATRKVKEEFVEAIVRELDSALQSLHVLYRNETTGDPLFSPGDGEVLGGVRDERHRPTGSRVTRVSRGAPAENTQHPGISRRENILAIIRSKGPVSIKDISDVIKDCSEKTIQRELIDMIKDNIITKEGERRWSKYSIAQ